jgi:hypothetical protein
VKHINETAPGFVTKILGIFLLAGTAFGQSYSPLYAPSTSPQFFAYCADTHGNLIPYCYMTLTTSYFANTNGHFHESIGHPYSSISPAYVESGGNGYAPVTLTTSIIGQAEQITVCAVVSGLCSKFQYAVGYTVYWNAHSDLWTQVGGNTTNHGDNTFNHWMTSNSAVGFYNASKDYQNKHAGLILSNDMALPFAGKFDLNDNWTSPHITHDHGTAADINGIPSANWSEFLQDCVNRGAIEAISETNSSLHCRWSN